MAGAYRLIENYIYIYQLDKYIILPVYPEQLTDNLGSQFAEENILSRTAPVYSYSHSGPRTVQFNFQLHRDLMNSVNASNLSLIDKELMGTTNLTLADDINEMLSRGDYIDILIRYSTFWVVIENKIFAWESKPNQTTIYEESINKINVDHLPVFYIYLKPNYNTSTPSNKHFKILYYSNLLDIFKTITINDLGDNKKNYIYLDDFSHLIERYLMNNLNLDSEEIKFYLNNKGKIDHIISNYKTQCKKVLTMLVEAIKSKFPDYIVHQTKTYIQVFKSTWENNKNIGIHFEILATEPNFENLINNKAFEFSFDIHNEQNTQNKYKNKKLKFREQI